MKADDTASGSPVEDLRAVCRARRSPLSGPTNSAHTHSDLNHLGVPVPDLCRCVSETAGGRAPGPARTYWLSHRIYGPHRRASRNEVCL